MKNEEDIVKSELSFEEWNKQFEDNRNLDEYLPEYEMTLREYRRQIYKAEIGEEISREEFFESMSKW